MHTWGIAAQKAKLLLISNCKHISAVELGLIAKSSLTGKTSKLTARKIIASQESDFPNKKV